MDIKGNQSSVLFESKGSLTPKGQKHAASGS